MGLSVDYLYSLYDALVSINVPSDKARAVVDAMERDMGTTLATKQDLLQLASKKDLMLVKQEVALLRHEVLGIRAQCKLEPESGFTRLLGSLDRFYDDFTRKLDEFERKLTIRFGVMFYSGCILLIVVKRYWT